MASTESRLPLPVCGTARQQLVAVALAGLCAVLFLGDALLPGRALVPYPPEANQPLFAQALADGADLAEILRGNAAMGDKYNQSLFWDWQIQAALEEGRLPLWTRALGGGVPYVPQMGLAYQPWNLLLWLGVPSVEVYGYWYLGHLLLIGWFAYRFLRRVGAGHDAALLGVVCATLGLWSQARLHHNVILAAAVPAFWMLSALHALWRGGGGARAAGGLALATGWSWLGGMPQISLLLTYLAAGWAAALWWRSAPGQRLRPALWTAFAFGIGAAIGALQMGPVLLAARDSARTPSDEALLASVALPWSHLLSAVWPDLLAWPRDHFYGDIDTTRASWAALVLLDIDQVQLGLDKYPESAFAVGTLPLALAWVGLRGRVGAFFGVVALGALLLVTATPPVLQVSGWLPGLRVGDLRRGLVLVWLALGVLGALGLDRAARDGRPRLAVAWCAGVALLSAYWWWRHQAPAAQLELEWLSRIADAWGLPAEERDAGIARARAVHLGGGQTEANLVRLRETFGRTALVAAAGAGLLWCSRRRWARGALVLLTAIELVVVGRGPAVVVESQRVTTPPRVLAPVLAATRAAEGPRPRFQRLLPADAPRPTLLLRPNLGAFYGLEDLSSYHPLPPRRQEELCDAIAPGVAMGGVGVEALRDAGRLEHPMFDVLGLQWVLSAVPVESPAWRDRTPADAAGPFRLYERARPAAPRAVFLTDVVIEPDRERRLALLADPRRDARRQIVLEDPTLSVPPAGEAVATVEVVAHEDERVRIDVRTDRAGYLRLADPWDPGWRATVNGAAAPVVIADHYLRAVWLPAGAHRVEFTYDGPTVVLPRRIGGLGLLVAVALWLAGRRRQT